MPTLTMQPSLNQLYDFVSKVRSFPISVGQLLELAEKKGEPRTILNFYSSFPRDEVFTNQDDLTGRSELVEIVRRDEADMPREAPFVPVED